MTAAERKLDFQLTRDTHTSPSRASYGGVCYEDSGENGPHGIT